MKTATSLRRIMISLATGVTGAVFALLPLGVSAATSSPNAGVQSYQISPPTANFTGDKGSTQQGTIKVTNLTDAPLSVRVGKENFVAKGEEGEIELVDNADPLYSLAPWFGFSVTQLDIPARGTKELHYTITVPAGAEPGGRYGSVVFSTIPPKLPAGQSGAAVEQTLAGIVFLRINGTAAEQLKLATFETGHLDAKSQWLSKNFFENGPVDFLTRVQNSGNVHEKPTGTITIKNMLGFRVATIPLDQHFVIPGAVRRLHNAWPTGKSKPFLFGTYTAHLDATYASGKKLTADTSFTVIPYKLVAAVLFVILFLFVVLFRGRKRLARAGRILAGKE